MAMILRRISQFLPVSALLWLLAAPLGAVSFQSGFEGPDYSPGFLVSDPDWSFFGVSVEILDTDAAEGSQSLGLQGWGRFSFSAEDPVAGQVRWLDFYLRPVFVTASDLPDSIETLQSAVSGFVDVGGGSGEIYVIDGDGLGSGVWVSSGVPVGLNGSLAQDWVRLTYRMDYGSKTWDLFVDHELARYDLGFLDDDFDRLQRFAVRADSAEVTGFDGFSAAGLSPLFTDLDHDGIDDLLDADPSREDRLEDADGDLIANIEEVRLGTNLQLRDSDGDFLADGMELKWGMDPRVANGALFKLDGGAWETSFESDEGYVFGDLHAQLGWDSYGVDVTADEAAYAIHEGPVEVYAEHFFGTDPEARIWFGFRAKLYAAALPDAGTLEGPTAAVFGFSAPYTLSVLDASVTAWEAVEVDATSSEWNEYAVFLDYVSKTWELYLNGQLVASEMSFSDPELQSLSRFRVSMEKAGGSDAASYMDDLRLYAGNDFDGDGLGDDWERFFDLNPANVDSDGDEIPDVDEDVDGDGLGMLAEYLGGHHPLWEDADVDVYVDRAAGDDVAYNGRSALPDQPQSGDGPKRSLGSAIGASHTGEVVLIQPGTYDETTLSLNGKDVTLRLNGAGVTLR